MSNKRPLYIYVLGVIVVWLAILVVLLYTGNTVNFHKALMVGSGFGLGMIAMYIAVHLYQWK